jgi:glycosyltransferase involved in cell wall biosynthesis
LLDALTLLARHGLRPSVRLGGYTDGEEGRLAIQEGIRQRGLENQVELNGRIPQAHVPTWLRGGRIGLVPLQPIAKFLKNIPSKMFEYWACGLPVIASDLPPIRRFVSDGKNGLLFDPSSPQDLARAIHWLIERPEEAEAIGRHGQQQIYEHWNNDHQVDRLIQFYERVRRH